MRIVATFPQNEIEPRLGTKLTTELVDTLMLACEVKPTDLYVVCSFKPYLLNNATSAAPRIGPSRRRCFILPITNATASRPAIIHESTANPLPQQSPSRPTRTLLAKVSP